jgi:hypothetical protein
MTDGIRSPAEAVDTLARVADYLAAQPRQRYGQFQALLRDSYTDSHANVREMVEVIGGAIGYIGPEESAQLLRQAKAEVHRLPIKALGFRAFGTTGSDGWTGPNPDEPEREAGVAVWASSNPPDSGGTEEEEGSVPVVAIALSGGQVQIRVHAGFGVTCVPHRWW